MSEPLTVDRLIELLRTFPGNKTTAVCWLAENSCRQLELRIQDKDSIFHLVLPDIGSDLAAEMNQVAETPPFKHFMVTF